MIWLAFLQLWLALWSGDPNGNHPGQRQQPDPTTWTHPDGTGSGLTRLASPYHDECGNP